MDQCPTCRAPYREGNVCYRCQTDWRQVLVVERAAVRCRQQAIVALQSRRCHTAYDYAKWACKLHRCSESIRVLALASLGLRKFDDALALWKEYRGWRPTQVETAGATCQPDLS
ncbi:hypothetical protein M1N79_02125 [Dehalococcoidia bacterium]|nr:hypothetical protein [Dehalococcoidia bacterium]